MSSWQARSTQSRNQERGLCRRHGTPGLVLAVELSMAERCLQGQGSVTQPSQPERMVHSTSNPLGLGVCWLEREVAALKGRSQGGGRHMSSETSRPSAARKGGSSCAVRHCSDQPRPLLSSDIWASPGLSPSPSRGPPVVPPLSVLILLSPSCSALHTLHLPPGSPPCLCLWHTFPFLLVPAALPRLLVQWCERPLW